MCLKSPCLNINIVTRAERVSLSVLSKELSDVLLVHFVVEVLLPLNSRNEQHLVSVVSRGHPSLDLGVVVGQTRHSASLPREVSDVESVLSWDEEAETVGDEGPLVHVAPHRWVSCLHHLS